MNSNNVVISVANLEHSYGSTKVLNGLNFTIEKGKIFGLFGKNGAGKTTTINILMGFLTPEKGECIIYGEKAASLSNENKRRIGLLHEGHISYDFMTLEQTEKFYKDFFPNWESKTFAYFMEKLGLPKNRKIKHMSCGQRSQVALAVLMAQGAETLILDDFSMGLDAGYRRLFLDHLNHFVKDNNKTILITSHIVQDLERFVDEAVIINKGHVLLSAPLSNIKDGIDYLLVPDWEVLSDPKVWAMALGQALFSLSLAGSGMVVYGSYLKDDINIPKAAVQTAIFSSLGALLCAFVVIPAVFAFGISAKAGPPLVFISIPLVFQKMPFGYFFSILFNISILFAAVSSLINLMECPIEALENRLKLSRKAAVISIGIIMIAVGIFIEKADKVGSWMDFVSVYIVPTGAMLSGVMIFWIFGMKTFRENVEKGMNKPLPKWFDFMAKYVFVGVSVLILILSITLGGF